jgi:glyoxylase-like metal-dependent hydrolase (beta-lactamase superfamily II)
VSNIDAPGYGGPGRPDPVALWETVHKRKHALDLGNAVMPSHGAQMKMCMTEEEVAAADL